MKASERLEIIIDEVQTNGIVKVAEISGRLGCSEVTMDLSTHSLTPRMGITVFGVWLVSVSNMPPRPFSALPP